MYKEGYLNKNINIWSYFSSKAKILKGTVHILPMFCMVLEPFNSVTTFASLNSHVNDYHLVYQFNNICYETVGFSSNPATRRPGDSKLVELHAGTSHSRTATCKWGDQMSLEAEIGQEYVIMNVGLTRLKQLLAYLDIYLHYFPMGQAYRYNEGSQRIISVSSDSFPLCLKEKHDALCAWKFSLNVAKAMTKIMK